MELKQLVSQSEVSLAASSAEDRQAADRLGALAGGTVYLASVASAGGVVFFLTKAGLEKKLGLVWADEGEAPACVADFDGQGGQGEGVAWKLCPTGPANAAALRQQLPFTAPRLLGLSKSVGLGDRLGIATPGHARAVAGTDVMPIFAQQSIREMTRTERNAQEVIDAGTWGVFQAGWRGGYGSDADHLKSTDDIDATLAAGFCMFTIDPGDHVDNDADTASLDALKAKFDAMPWADLGTTADQWRADYVDQTFTLTDDLSLMFSEETLLRAAVKYGAAVGHTAKLARHLDQRAGDSYELEMSVDETETPTTLQEHYFVARELKRLGVRWVSLAPRFIGEFEKGVDYKGDLGEFERQFIGHVAIAKQFGPYKLSIHSGSDKFTIYPIAAKHAGELIHVKTAGTSYLEALRVVAMKAPALFREIMEFARERFETDKATYHISAVLSKFPASKDLSDDQLAALLNDEDENSRQIFHVTFGSVLTWKRDDGGWRFRDRVMTVLREHEETYCQVLDRHLSRHVKPFAG